MIEYWIRFDSIEKDREGYFLTYSPVFSGQPFATLTLTFYENTTPSEAVKLVEYEFDYWVNKYRTPLMAFIKDETKNGINYQSFTDNDYLIGYPLTADKIKKVWGQIDESEFEAFDLSNDKLKLIYSGLEYRTRSDADQEIKEQAKGFKLFRYASILWFCVIPALIAWLGWSNPTVSLIAFFYSLYLAYREYLKIQGRLKKSEREKVKEEDSRLKEHHHYHCKLNPEGFARLKLENFKKKQNQELKNKIESLRS